MADAANSHRVRIVEKDIGATVLGRRLKYYAIGTPDNIANLDAGRNDGAFWRGVVSGEVPASRGLAAGALAAGVRVDHRDAARLRAGGGRGDQPPALRARGPHGLPQPVSG